MELHVDYESEMEAYSKKMIDWVAEEFKLQMVAGKFKNNKPLGQALIDYLTCNIFIPDERTETYFHKKIAELERTFPQYFNV